MTRRRRATMLWVILLMAAPLFKAARYRACASRGLAFAAAHFIDGCALSRLHSQPLILLMAARYRACIRSRS
jgi:hypothetical protein